MPNIKISAAADAGTLVSSDMLPLARSGDTNAYHATMTEVANFTNASVASGAYNNVGRNLLHNSQFAVAQRGAGSWTAAGYGLDRWTAQLSNGTISWGQNALTDAGRAAIGDEAAKFDLACTFAGGSAAADFTSIVQLIEDVRRLAGKTVTLSFWAIASVPLRLGAAFIQTFGTGGSPSAGVSVNGQSVLLSTTWAKYSVPIALPSAAGKTLGTNGNDSTSLYLLYSAGSGNAAWSGNVGVQSGSINLWGVQLEVGGTATPLEKLDPQQDLAKCQRFYQDIQVNSVGYAPAGTTIAASASPMVTMRASPTLTVSGDFTSNLNGLALGGNKLAYTLSGNVVATGAYNANMTIHASADL